MQVCTSSQITVPTSHHSVFYRPDALPAAQPTASKLSRPYIYFQDFPGPGKLEFQGLSRKCGHPPLGSQKGLAAGLHMDSLGELGKGGDGKGEGERERGKDNLHLTLFFVPENSKKADMQAVS